MAIYAQPIVTNKTIDKIKLSSRPENGDMIVWNQQTQSFDPMPTNELRDKINSGYKVKRYFFSNF